jgi:hypothetical protein
MGVSCGWSTRYATATERYPGLGGTMACGVGVPAATPTQEETTIPTKVDSMSDLYARLASLGFDRTFLRAAILPEWWEDSLAEVPANRALAEDLFARGLGLRVSDLSQPSVDLQLPSLNRVKFKRYKNHVDERVAPAILIAQHAARIVVGATSLPPFELSFDAASVRQEIVRHNRYVDLPSL